MNNTEKIIVLIYAILVIALAFVSGAIHNAEITESGNPGESGIGMLLWITSPLVLGLIFTFFSSKRWSDFRISFKTKGSGLWWSVTFLIYPAVILISTSAGLITGKIFINPGNLQQFFGIIVFSTLFSAIKNIFEEFAWRGYLAPKVYREKNNIYRKHILVGLVWGIWHIPFLEMFWTYISEENKLLFILLFLFGAIAQSIVYGEIRIKTKSVVPAWLMHTIGSILGTAFLSGGLFNIAPGYEMIFSPGTDSIIGSTLMLLTGIFLVNRRKQQTILTTGKE